MSDPDNKKQKTKMFCHNCKDNFLAELDYGLNGNHEIICPYCDHVHYRVIKDGEVTAERYKSSSTITYTCKTWTTNSTDWTSATMTTSSTDVSNSTTTFNFSGTYNVKKTDGWTYINNSWNNTIKG